MKHKKIMLGRLGLAGVTITGLSRLYVVVLRGVDFPTARRGVR